MPDSTQNGDEGANEIPQSGDAVLNPDKAEMPVDDRRNSALALLFLLAQAYHRILESVISKAAWCCQFDQELNQSYDWTITSIARLLANHPDLRDFPSKFEPAFPDLCPSTILDFEWQGELATDVEQFVNSVRRYVQSKDYQPPVKKSAGWIFVELFRPSVDRAVQRAVAYGKRMGSFLQATSGDTGLNGALRDAIAARDKASEFRSQESRKTNSADRKRPLKGISPGKCNFRSPVKNAILTELIKQPALKDVEICRALDRRGGCELPRGWKSKADDRLFFKAYLNSDTRHRVQITISKVRRALRERGFLP